VDEGVDQTPGASPQSPWESGGPGGPDVGLPRQSPDSAAKFCDLDEQVRDDGGRDGRLVAQVHVVRRRG
jgi:hypothetical protein